jgi:hypothetical protein
MAIFIMYGFSTKHPDIKLPRLGMQRVSPSTISGARAGGRDAEVREHNNELRT